MTRYFEAFERGDKNSELRLHNYRWNEDVCYKGRAATLSKGYGKYARLSRVVSHCVVYKSGHDLPAHYIPSAFLLYGTLDKEFIEIFLEKPLLLL